MKAFLLSVFLLMAGLCHAQSVQIEEKEQSINGILRRGQQLSVQLDPKIVEKTWKEHLTSKAGKLKYNKGVYTTEKAVLDTISATPMRLVSTVGSDAQGSYVWWNLDMGTAYVDKNATPKEYAAAENFMRDFAKKVYREDVFRQINQAEDVLAATKLEQDRVVKQANDIQLTIEKNAKRKQELQAELARNAEELKQLEQNVQNNLKQQEASRQQVAEMEKAVDAVRIKLQAIK